MIAGRLLNFALLWIYATVPPEWKPVVTGALGLLLVGAASSRWASSSPR